MIPRLIVNIIFLIYGKFIPFCRSYQVVKSGNEIDIKQWLMHWIIFTTYLQVLNVTDILLGFWFPLYNEIILILFLWITSPTERGYEVLYYSYFNPIFSKYEHVLENSASIVIVKSIRLTLWLTVMFLKQIVGIPLHGLKDIYIRTFNPAKCLVDRSFEPSIDVDVISDMMENSESIPIIKESPDTSHNNSMQEEDSPNCNIDFKENSVDTEQTNSAKILMKGKSRLSKTRCNKCFNNKNSKKISA